MLKNFYQFMSDSEDFSPFANACEELINSKYIFADSCICAVLKNVAGNRLLFDFFADCASGFNFQAKLAEYTKEQDGLTTLEYPKDCKQFVCFVLGLLYMFDVRKIELNSFLKQYYADDDGIGASYKKFITEAIVPFKQLVLEQAQE